MTTALKDQQVDAKRKAHARSWITDPLSWAQDMSGEEFDPWSGQIELWHAYGRVLNAKIKRYHDAPMTDEERELASKMGISVMAGHGLGKERTLALMELHYQHVLKSYQPKGVCTAPAGPTLHSTLWPEFVKVIASSPALTEIFEAQSDRIFLKEDQHRGKFSRIEPRTIQQNSSEDDQAVVLAGIHAIGVFYGITEASGVQNAVMKPLEGGLTDPLSLIVLIFNPTKRTGFAADSHGVNRRDWVCLQWSGRTLKQEKAARSGHFKWFNAEAQDVLIRKFGDDSDFVRIRVDGLPPRQASDTLIGYEDVMAAIERHVETLPGDPMAMALDVAGENSGDKSIKAALRGPKLVALTEWKNRTTTQLGDLMAASVKTEVMSLDPDVQIVIGVDVIGIGRGVFYHMIDVEKMQHVIRIDVSEVALDEKRFGRLRDQVYWELREAFVEDREIVLAVLNDSKLVPESVKDDLIGQLTSIKWAEVKGKIKIQGKGTESGIPGVKPLTSSPDEMDALAMAWFIYKHYCSRIPAGVRRQRRANWRRALSWKVR